jgi:hypothetical protein
VLPDRLIFKCAIEFEDSTSCEETVYIEVGVRTDDVIVVGWIDSNLVTLPVIGVSPWVAALFPSPAPPSANPCTCNLAILELSQNDTTPLGFTMFPIDRTYILNWMFKFGGNADPSSVIPGGDFRNAADTRILEGEVVNFSIFPTNYKLFNRFQVRYVPYSGGFGWGPSVLKDNVLTGETVNPCGPCLSYLTIFPSRQGPHNGDRTVRASPARISKINDGSPDAGAISAFNTLMGKDLPPGVTPLFWESIGSRLTFRYDGGFAPEIVVQAYPTYYVYANGTLVSMSVQAGTPGAHFFTNPYPFGTVNCIRYGGITPGGRCGDAVSPEDPSARIPPFTLP